MASDSYSATAKLFHWVAAALVIFMIAAGIAMTQIEGLNTLYDTHKLVGFCLLWIMLARLAYRLVHGAPPDEPTLAPLQRIVSHVVHWGLYAAVIVMPIIGWLGISAYPANSLYGGAVTIPAIVGEDKAFAERMFGLHEALGYVIVVLVAMHVGAAFFHWLIVQDGVMQRMLPGGRPRRSGVLRETR